MAEKSKKPAIRFAGFTEAWEQRKLGEVVDVCSGCDYKQLSAGNIPVYGTGGYMLSVNSALSYKNDAIGIGRKGTIDKPYILNAPFWTVDTLFYAIPRGNNDLDFIFDIFQNVDWRTKDESTGVPSLSKNAINNINILTPKYDEQRIVGSYFSKLDTLITLHQRKYDKLVNVKKAILEKMFPKDGADVPEIRFKGFTEAWEQRKLGNLASFSKGYGYSKSDLMESGTPIILYGRLYTNYETVISDVDTYVNEKKGSVYSRGGEIIVPASGETAEDISVASVVEKQGVLLGGDLNIVNPAKILNPVFLAISISNGNPHKEMTKMAQGKSVVHLHNADLEKINLNFPSCDEQVLISTYFQNIDNIITLHQRKLEKLKNLKKACLEKMFV